MTANQQELTRTIDTSAELVIEMQNGAPRPDAPNPGARCDIEAPEYEWLRRLRLHDNSCLLYSSDKEWATTVAGYVAFGLRREEKVLYLHHIHDCDEVRDVLRAAGVDVAHAEGLGQLVFHNVREEFERRGEITSSELLAFLVAATDQAVDEGYSGLRVTIEMHGRFQGPDGAAWLRETNTQLNHELYPAYPIANMAQFDLRTTSAYVQKEALSCHRLVVNDYHVYDNFYYVPPQRFVIGNEDTHEVRHWLANLAREHASRGQARMLSDALNNSAYAFLAVFPDGRLKAWNAAFAKLTGYSDAELRSSKWTQDLVPAEWQEDQAQMLADLRATGRPQRFEMEYVRKDGSRVPVETFTNRYLDAEGNLDYYDSFVVDITERRRAEDALRQERDFSSTVVDTTSVLILVLDADGRIVKFNTACESVTGFAFAEVAGARPWEALVPPECRDKERTSYDAVRTERDSVEFENYWKTKDGGRRLISWRCNKVRDRQGQIVWIVGVGIDITEARQAEEGLRLAEERFRSVAQSASDVIYEYDIASGQVTWFGNVDGRLGYEPEEWPRTWEAWQEAILPDDRPRLSAPQLRAEAAPSPYSEEYRVLRKDGTVLYWTDRGSVLVGPDGRPMRVVGAITDVTERKLAEEAVRESQEQLRRITENMVDMVTQINPQGIIEYVSPSHHALLGYPAEELLGTSLVDLIHSEDQDVLRQALAGWANGAGETKVECRCRHAAGHYVTLESVGKALVDERGAFMGAVLGSREVTARRVAEEELRQTLSRLKRTIAAIVDALAATTERRDPYTAGHQRRVAELATAISHYLKLPDSRIEGIRVAAALHDIGKISIPAEILSKAGRLSAIELEMVRVHVGVGHEILAPIDFPWPIATIVSQHHERLDGSGYPNGIAGDEILLDARILAVADVVESMSSHRPYRPALGLAAALDEIASRRGVLYDAEVVDACLALFQNDQFTFTMS